MPNPEQLGSVFLDLAEEQLSVAELIRRTVEEQVRELTVRRRLEAAQARQVLERQYLTPDDVAAQAIRGAVRYPSSKPLGTKGLDAEAEVQKALRAFERQAYVVLVDGRQAERPDEVVRFAPGSKVTFVRLTPLVGG